MGNSVERVRLPPPPPFTIFNETSLFLILYNNIKRFCGSRPALISGKPHLVSPEFTRFSGLMDTYMDTSGFIGFPFDFLEFFFCNDIIAPKY